MKVKVAMVKKVENCTNCPFKEWEEIYSQGFCGTQKSCQIQKERYSYNTNWEKVFKNCPLKESKVMVTL